LKRIQHKARQIAKVINMDPEINLQGQFDQPFLLGESPSKVARRLNDIAHLDIIDKLLSKISKRKFNHNSRKKLLDEQIAEIERETKNFPEKKIKEAIFLITKRNEVKAKIRDLTEIQTEIKKQEKILRQLEGRCLPQRRLLDKILRLEKHWGYLSKRRKGILWHKKQIERIEEQIERIGISIEELRASYNKIKPRTCPLCGGDFK